MIMNPSQTAAQSHACFSQFHAISTFLPGLFPAQAHSGLQHPECTVRGTDIQLFGPLKGLLDIHGAIYRGYNTVNAVIKYRLSLVPIPPTIAATGMPLSLQRFPIPLGTFPKADCQSILPSPVITRSTPPGGCQNEPNPAPCQYLI